MIVIKKFKLNTKYLEISLYVLFVVFLIILFFTLVSNFGSIWDNIAGMFSFVQKTLMPFIIGFFVAYFMNTTVRWIERVLLSRISVLTNRPGIKRMISVVVTFIMYIGLLLLTISYIIPQVLDGTRGIINNLTSQRNIQALESLYNDLFSSELTIPFLHVDQLVSSISSFLTNLLQGISNMPTIVNKILAGTVVAANSLVTALLSFVVSFYMLVDKENFAKAIIKLLQVIFKEKTADKIVEIARSSNKIVESFIIGKVIDSAIVGVIFFAVSMMLKLPYALILSLIVGVTNMIPYFGPFVGCIVSSLLVLFVDPALALVTLIATFLLQQLDGAVIGPKILGDSTGLRPIYVVFAIIVGGAMFGIPGMFFGTPVFAVIKNMVGALIDRKHDEKYKRITP